MNVVPITAVSPRRGYRGIPAVPITVQTSSYELMNDFDLIMTLDYGIEDSQIRIRTAVLYSWLCS